MDTAFLLASIYSKHLWFSLDGVGLYLSVKHLIGYLVGFKTLCLVERVSKNRNWATQPYFIEFAALDEHHNRR
jgi:hypothetical protein